MRVGVYKNILTMDPMFVAKMGNTKQTQLDLNSRQYLLQSALRTRKGSCKE